MREYDRDSYESDDSEISWTTWVGKEGERGYSKLEQATFLVPSYSHLLQLLIVANEWEYRGILLLCMFSNDVDCISDHILITSQ